MARDYTTDVETDVFVREVMACGAVEEGDVVVMLWAEGMPPDEHSPFPKHRITLRMPEGILNSLCKWLKGVVFQLRPAMLLF